MEKKEATKQVKKKRNPLCYFAALGIIGFIGVYMMSPVIMVFLLFFFFWGYRNMTPDELFWENVRRAGLRAFAAGVAVDAAAMIFLIVRALPYMFGFGGAPYDFAVLDGMVQMNESLFMHYVLLTYAFTIQMVVSLCTFFFSLMHFRKKEEKGAEEMAC